MNISKRILFLGAVCGVTCFVYAMDKISDHSGMTHEFFKHVVQIRGIVEEERKTCVFHGVRVQPGATGWLDPNPFYGQTKQGFFLRVDGRSDILYTPWGEIRLFFSEDGKKDAFVGFYQMLAKRLGLTFVRAVRPLLLGDTAQFYALSHDGDLKKECSQISISEETLQAFEGTDTYVYSNCKGYAFIYAIHAIDGRPLPEPEALLRQHYADYDAVKYNWATMLCHYKAETKSA